MPRPVLMVLALALFVAPAAALAESPPESPPVLVPGAPGLGPISPRAPHVPKPPAADQYVVELTAPPLARYSGGVKGLAPTAPAKTGHKLDVGSAAAKAWTRELADRQAQVIAAAAPGVKPTASYRTAFAGFAAKLTAEQAKALRAQPGVAHVTRERFLRVSASGGAGGVAGSESDLLGLPNGLWKRLGGQAKAGRGVTVGIVDTGITPEAPSFADHSLPTPASWDGACQGGDHFPVTSCTNKLIGARYFVDGIGRDNIEPDEFLSPRDAVGHGTHVAASAVGDYGVDPKIAGNALGVDRLTGIAPAAYLAAYKVCWNPGFCSDVDIIDGIDTAVRDGVDVINMSLGGFHDPSVLVDPIEEATLGADAAGVLVATAAGNEGTFPGALNSPATAPWTTAVAATTGARTFRSTLHVTAGGKSVDLPASTTWTGFTNVPLFDAASLNPDDDQFLLRGPGFCVPDAFTRAQVQGKVVVCDLWAPPGLMEQVLSQLGAKGVIIAVAADELQDPIVSGGTLPMAVIEEHEVAALRKLTDPAAGTGRLTAPAATAASWTPDRIADFSSRGPAPTTQDLLRPDVAAPGVNTLSAVPGGFAVYSGTSMATPQVAGAGALLTQLHPAWSPAQIRSALVTTARPVTDRGGPATPVEGGAGRIDPTAAADPGLVIAPSTSDYRAFADATLQPRDLNMPSIQIGNGAGFDATVTRTVTSVADARTSWTATGQYANGVLASVSPAHFAISPGQSQALHIEAAAFEGAPEFQTAHVTLTDTSGHTARIPVSLDNPGVQGAPEAIDVANAPAAGSQTVTATAAGTVRPVGFGLAKPQVRRGLKTIQPELPDRQEYQQAITLDKPTPLLAVDVEAPEKAEVQTRIYRDVDGDGRWTPVDYGDQVSPEPDFEHFPQHEADATDLPAGKYVIWIVAEPHDGTITFDLRTWTVDDPKPDDPEPAPGLVAGGDVSAFSPVKHDFPLSWSGVTGSEPLRGVVEWRGHDDGTVLARSIVRLTPAQATARSASR
jgi:subtilisin family serine protease